MIKKAIANGRGQLLSTQEVPNLRERSTVWNVNDDISDFQIVEGEDAEGRFALLVGSLTGTAYLIRDKELALPV